MKFYEYLFGATKHRKCGNHSCEVVYEGDRRSLLKFNYFDTCICIVDLINRTYFLGDGGYGTMSTHRALAAYNTFLDSKGFRLAGLYLCNFYGFPYHLEHN